MQVELGHLDEVGDLDALVGTVGAPQIGVEVGGEHRCEPVGHGAVRLAHPVGVAEAHAYDRHERRIRQAVRDVVLARAVERRLHGRLGATGERLEQLEVIVELIAEGRVDVGPYADPSVLTGSVHVDPGAGWFPHLLGYADETGAGPGAGSNRNLPLAPGSGDGPWLEAVAALAAWAREGEARALVVALGVDAARRDPESPLDVTVAGYRAAGRALGELGLPTVVVLEGGYELETIGELVSEALAGVEEGAGSR
jgi:Histone deacetylase domain